MGADLFGSFAESTCAALVISSVSPQLNKNWNTLMFPLTLSAVGILWSLFTSYFATDFERLKVKKASDVERNLKYQIFISTLVMTPLSLITCLVSLPSSFCTSNYTSVQFLQSTSGIPITNSFTLCGKTSTALQASLCIISGLWSGMIIGSIFIIFYLLMCI